MSKELIKNVQEHVAHVYRIESNGRPCVAWDDASGIEIGAKLYTAHCEWSGLDDDEVHQAFCHAEYETPYRWNENPEGWCKAFYKYVEAKLKEKNGG